MTSIEISRWLSCYEPRPSPRLRMFCFPFAGGSASAYRGWSAGLPHDVEVCPLQFPGREGRFTEPAFRRMSELVSVLGDVLAPLLDLPFAFYGHSMGSIVAFELAHELRMRGKAFPCAVFPAAQQGPKISHVEALSELPDQELTAHLGKLSDTAQIENPDLLELMLPTLRCDLALCDFYTYRHRPKLNCPITAFGGQEDTVSRVALEAWSEETEGPFEVEILPGGHFFLSSSRKNLLEILSRKLSSLAC